MPQLLSGNPVASALYQSLQLLVPKLKNHKIQPRLVVVLVGEDPASEVYVKNKTAACEKLGLAGETLRLPSTVSQAEMAATVQRLNEDASVHGILVQLPLPAHLDRLQILWSIHPDKDVDGIHPVNLGKLVYGKPELVACTPSGIMEILKFYRLDVAGKHAVVVGRSEIVGKPMTHLLLNANATVTVCHSHTKDLAAITRQADFLIAALGKPRFIKREHVKPGAVVVDVGIHRLESGKLCGDVDAGEMQGVAGFLSPVPGGVGPLTIAMLMKNLITAASRAKAVPTTR
jgi:methylenetetrahydrofolate dehydrogenase (NADP+) / methenyltetrahydrofolate cyclohydrolase